MSYIDMSVELRGSVPKLPFDLAKTYLNRAYRVIRERNLWSFLLFEGQWITPPAMTTGTATTVIGVNTATLDSDARTALNTALAAQPYSLVTQRQFRMGLSGIYNIWGYNPATGVLTLDRPWGEASATTQPYQVYQCYYVPQANAGASPSYLSDFKSWISVRNFQNFVDLYSDRYNRQQVDAIDPQRSQYFFPTDVIPYQRDQNPASATYGYFMFELWGQPLSLYTYQLLGIRRGLDLSNPGDRLPPALGEDVVLALAKTYAYEWAEAQSGLMPRGTGPDWKFLMGKSLKEYESLLRTYRMADRETVDNFFSIRRNAINSKVMAYYNSVGGTAYPGGI